MARKKREVDEDLDFVIDTYQNAMSPFSTPLEESHARRKMMKGIAARRAPQTVPILDQIEKIVKNCEYERITLDDALKKLEKISAKYGDKDLHKGVKMKIGMIKGEKPKDRMEKPVALFSNIKEPKRPTLTDIAKDTKKKGKPKPLFDFKERKRPTLADITKQTKKKTKKKKKRGKKKDWDPLTDEHPMAGLFGGK
jgi:hypothetical protein